MDSPDPARGAIRLCLRNGVLLSHVLDCSASRLRSRPPFRLEGCYRRHHSYAFDRTADLAHRAVAFSSFNMTGPLDFTGKVALVTGSSRGIGAEMIKAFDNRVATCVVNYFTDPQGHNKADAANVARELKDPLIIDCDVTQPAQVEQMMKQIQDRHGGLDILVNNSGIIRDRTIKKMSLEEFESIIRVNLTGTFNVTHKPMPILRNAGPLMTLSSLPLPQQLLPP